MKGLILALQFFTRIPVSVKVDFNEKNIRSAFYFLPLLGAAEGALILLVLYLFPASSRSVAAAVCVIFYFALTGGLHLDGLADTFDGFLSAKQKEKILEIMQDPANGTFGTAAVCSTLLLRYAVYSNPIPRSILIVAAGLVSRLCGLAVVIFSKPAKENGLGASFHKAASKTGFWFWLGLTCMFCFFLPEYSLPFFHVTSLSVFIRLKFLLLPATAFFVAYITVKIAYKKIGGTTGDVNGCIVELTELAALTAAILM